MPRSGDPEEYLKRVSLEILGVEVHGRWRRASGSSTRVCLWVFFCIGGGLGWRFMGSDLKQVYKYLRVRLYLQVSYLQVRLEVTAAIGKNTLSQISSIQGPKRDLKGEEARLAMIHRTKRRACLQLGDCPSTVSLEPV